MYDLYLNYTLFVVFCQSDMNDFTMFKKTRRQIKKQTQEKKNISLTKMGLCVKITLSVSCWMPADHFDL